jgi:hypothetical protein
MSSVEAKSEFVEGVVEMLMLDAAVERPREPSLEQRVDLVNPRHQFMGCFGSTADRTDLVSVNCHCDDRLGLGFSTRLPSSVLPGHRYRSTAGGYVRDVDTHLR